MSGDSSTSGTKMCAHYQELVEGLTELLDTWRTADPDAPLQIAALGTNKLLIERGHLIHRDTGINQTINLLPWSSDEVERQRVLTAIYACDCTQEQIGAARARLEQGILSDFVTCLIVSECRLRLSRPSFFRRTLRSLGSLLSLLPFPR